MRSTRTIRRWLVILLAPAVLAALWGCEQTRKDAEDVVEDPTPSVSCDNATPPVALQLDCPALPNTIASGKIAADPDTGQQILDYDLFAWNSFIALNWPAVHPEKDNGWKRGFPDTSKSFAAAAPDAVTVWETLKEKREIFLADPFTGHITEDPKVAAWNAPPAYGPADQQVPPCQDAEASEPAFERHLVHATKVDEFDTEDETAEVASEARETNEVLCKGHAPYPDCGVSGTPVGPRVWKGQPNDGGVPVVYEVKVNWDFYDYLKNFSGGPLWVQDNARQAATDGEIRLPARTSAPDAPYVPAGSHQSTPTHGFNPLVTDYSASACLEGDRTTPCPAGSIHLKAAWLPISKEEAASGSYHVAKAFYYKNKGKEKCKMPQTFGLIGLHIIQRIHQQEFGDDGAKSEAGPRGGTFVFATWEHQGNDDAGFTYANLGPTSFDGQPVDDPKPYPNVTEGEDAIPLARVYDLLDTTQNANAKVHDALGCTDGSGPQPSVWCNYFLVGTQYKAAQLPSPAPTLLTEIPDQPLPNVEAPAGSGQPYYLANLVIESNLGLQQFQGAPAGFAPVAHFTSPKPPPGDDGRMRGQGGDAPEIKPNPDGFKFEHGFANLAWRIAPRVDGAVEQSKVKSNDGQFDGSKRGAYNMGGCMGCHGVAQTQGYSFSFVLLDNQAGGSPDTQEEVVIPPLPLDAE